MHNRTEHGGTVGMGMAYELLGIVAPVRLAQVGITLCDRTEDGKDGGVVGTLVRRVTCCTPPCILYWVLCVLYWVLCVPF